MSRVFRSILSLAILGVCSPAGAIDPIPAEPGWSGFLILGGGVAEAETNMVAGIDVYGINVGEPRIDSLSDSPDSSSFGLPQVNLSETA